MVIVLESELSDPSASPGQDFTLTVHDTCSHSASLHPGVQMVTGKFNTGVTLRLTSIPSRGDQ